MRLLNTSTGVLHDFPHTKLPDYAILSHTWGSPEDEVLFVDLQQGTAKEKSGYQKLQRACDQAAADGLSWIWIDACCIDKNSSSELSESINSMYAWFAKAETCYAHLADVSSAKDKRIGELASSRWFKRGWTLQELIASSSLVFFSVDWVQIGTKATLPDELSKITGIDVGVLTGTKSLDSVSVAKKMSWASHRETSREEDIAYSLMGIFNVNMPLLYGEGGKAFIRLQEEIMKNSDDQSLFAWKDVDAFPSSSHGLLAKHPKSFADSSDIVPYRDWESRAPYLMSNRGLRIDLHLRRTEQIEQPDLYIAALDCPYPDDYEGFLGIYLKRISSGDHQYARTKLGEFCKIKARGAIQTVYVRQHIIRPTIQDIYPKHAIQLRSGPSREDGREDDYSIVDILVNPKPGDDIKVVEPARRAWVPKGLPLAFPVAKGVTQLSAALLFRCIDGEKVIVMLGSTNDFGIGFAVAAMPQHTRLSIDSDFLQFDPHPLGSYQVVQDHRVRVDAYPYIESGVKYYMVDVMLEAIEQTSTGVVKRVLPRLRRGITTENKSEETDKPSMPPHRGFKSLFKAGGQKASKVA